MKKSMIAAAIVAALGASGASAADLDFPKYLKPYVLIDTTISAITNGNAKGDTTVNYQTPWFSGSRWGMRGTLDTDTEISALYKLEGEFVTPTGEFDTPNVIFNRDAWVGFESGDLGRISLGRQNTLARDFSQNYGDAYGSPDIGLEEGGWTNQNNFKQLIFYAGSITSTRYDRGVVWKKKYQGGFVAGLGYEFRNQDQASTSLGGAGKGTTESVALAYNGAGFDVSGFVNSATNDGFSQKSYSIGGNYMVNGQLRVNAGYFHYTSDQPVALGKRKDNAYTVSMKYTTSPKWDYELGYQDLKADNAAYGAVGGNTMNPFTDPNGKTTAGTGSRSTVYGSGFYHMSKRIELYLAADVTNVKDGYVYGPTNGKSSQTEVGLGVRLKVL